MPANDRQKLGYLFRNRRERGRPGLPVMSVTLDAGLVGRDTLDRKTDTHLDPEEHLLIKEGDIAYNMMRMWQGASGLAKHDGIVSPAYVVLAPKNGIDPVFASYWFKSPRMVYLFWAYSYGLTNDRLRLYFKDFAEIPVLLPPHNEQVRIGEILVLWDTAIAQTEKLIEAKRQLKKGLMQQLLTGQRRFPGFKGKVQRYKFGQIVKLSHERYDPKTSKQDFRCVELEHIAQGDGHLLGTISSKKQNSIKAVFYKRDVLFGKLRPNLRKYLLCSFDGVCSTEIWVLKADSNICTDNYLYQLVQTNRFISTACTTTGSKMPRADWEWVSEQTYDLPPIPEQEKITSVLSVLDREIEVLKHLSNQLKEQKRGLMQQLLTGQIQVKAAEEMPA